MTHPGVDLCQSKRENDKVRERMSTTLELGSTSVSESDFLAQDTLITISPTFNHPMLRFISV